MVLIPASIRIFLAREPADMRRSFTGLCGLVRDQLGADPLSGHLYCFRNKRGDKLKMIYFDRTGLAIWYKRLEQGRFHWPPCAARSVELNVAEVAFMLEGVDLKGVKRHKRFSLERTRSISGI
jgi:transposase